MDILKFKIIILIRLQFINQDLLVASTSDGSVILLRVTDQGYDTVDMKELVLWDKIHKFSNGDISSCTGLSVYEEDVATIGEDGCLNLLTSKRETIVRTFGKYLFFILLTAIVFLF